MNDTYSILSVVLSVLLSLPIMARAGEFLPLNDGERILFIGNGHVENDQWQAQLETRLQRRFSDRKLTFRYMGWSGDTVRASARTAGFQVPQGMLRLEKETRDQKPTLIFLAYGMNESFDGSAALTGFLQDYDKLIKALAPLKVRLVILSPTYHEDLGRPFPDPAEHNRHLAQFTKALMAFAAERDLTFVNLYHPLEAAKADDAKKLLTTNGLLLTKAGYDVTAQAIENQLGYRRRRWEVTLTGTGKVEKIEGTKVLDVNAQEGSIRFQAVDAMLPMAPDRHVLRIAGLAPGEYQLNIAGQDILRAAAPAWDKGVDIRQGPMFDDAEKLRAAIVQRNQLFYRRWRPYNDHSRHWGFIGGDYKLYDQEIAKHDQQIADLRTPRPLTYEIRRINP